MLCGVLILFYFGMLFVDWCEWYGVCIGLVLVFFLLVICCEFIFVNFFPGFVLLF